MRPREFNEYVDSEFMEIYINSCGRAMKFDEEKLLSEQSHSGKLRHRDAKEHIYYHMGYIQLAL